MEQLLEQTDRILRLRNYSPKTRRAYLGYITEYLHFSKTKGLKNKQTAIEEFLLAKQNKGQAPQTINLALNALKFFYSAVVHDPEQITLKYAKRNQRLPVVLSRAEIELLLQATSNAKYRLMTALAYGCGLRVSEVVNLAVQDLDLDELVVRINNGKGRKDRLSIVPVKIRTDLLNIMAGKEPAALNYETPF